MNLSLTDYLIPCLTKKFFGIECYGCGAQRAMLLVFHGKFAEASHLYPAIFPLILFFFVVILNFCDKKRRYDKILLSLGILNVIIIIASYYFRYPEALDFLK